MTDERMLEAFQRMQGTLDNIYWAIRGSSSGSVRQPLTIGELAKAMAEGGNRGDLTLAHLGPVVSVAPGATFVQNFLTDGQPAVATSDLMITCDMYNATGKITAQAFVDGTAIVMPTNNLTSAALTGPVSISLAQYAVIRNNLQVLITNGTASTINATVANEQVRMSQALYNGVFVPLLKRFGFEALVSALADQTGGA